MQKKLNISLLELWSFCLRQVETNKAAVAVGDIGDELVQKLSEKVNALKVGPGMDKTSEKGL